MLRELPVNCRNCARPEYFLPTWGLAISDIEAGCLVQVPGDWCRYYPGYHLCFPSRCQSSAAFNIVVDALRVASTCLDGARLAM